MIKLLLALLFTAQAKTLHIAILDTGLPKIPTNAKICPHGVYDMTGSDVYDKLGHSTNIMGIISNRLIGVDYCLYIIKIYNDKPHLKFVTYLNSLGLLLNLDYVDIVNYSSSGPDYNLIEDVLISRLIKYGTKFVAAAGNQHMDLDKSCAIYPACYRGVLSVGNLNPDGTINSFSNYGKCLSAWRMGTNVLANGIMMTGTSQAAASYTADLALEMAKNVDKLKKYDRLYKERKIHEEIRK